MTTRRHFAKRSLLHHVRIGPRLIKNCRRSRMSILVDFFVIALWNLLSMNCNFVRCPVHTAPFTRRCWREELSDRRRRSSTTRHFISWVEESPSQQPPQRFLTFFVCLQWPKNRVGLQAPLHTANRRAGGETRARGGRKSPSGAKIAFPGCVHAHSGSFWGGHLKYYINWRTKITRFWLVEFPCTQIFFFFKKISHQN